MVRTKRLGESLGAFNPRALHEDLRGWKKRAQRLDVMRGLLARADDQDLRRLASEQRLNADHGDRGRAAASDRWTVKHEEWHTGGSIECRDLAVNGRQPKRTILGAHIDELVHGEI